jgi:hypothetical protein
MHIVSPFSDGYPGLNTKTPFLVKRVGLLIWFSYLQISQCKDREVILRLSGLQISEALAKKLEVFSASDRQDSVKLSIILPRPEPFFIELPI